MADYKDREHYIPLRKAELIDLLVTDKDMPHADREPFRQFCKLTSAIYHYEYLQRLEDLKNDYAPFDPDADTKSMIRLSPEVKQQRLDDLFAKFVRLMERANYKHLDRKDCEAAIAGGASDWGVNMDVDFSVFERLEIFARGDSIGKRSRRRALNWWRLEEVELPIYQRLVLILKLRPHKRLGSQVNTDHVYLKLFKEIPKLDLEMLLPGVRVQMPGVQRLKLGGSLLGTLGFVAWKLAQDITQLLVARSPLVFWGPISLVAGYGYKQYAGYQSTKQSYSLMLTESLYYQNLDNNAGVITHVVDAAEEQECREAILAYYFLWRYAGQHGWTSGDLDDYIELDLDRRCNLKVDFEIDDALDKLAHHRLIEKIGDRYRAQPLDKALQTLDWIWDNYFKYNSPDVEEPAVGRNLSGETKSRPR